MIDFVFIIVCGFIGAYINRIRGGGLWPDLPRPIDQLLFSLPFLVLMIVEGCSIHLSVLAFIASAVFNLTGHGQYFPSLVCKPIDKERFDFIVSWFHGKDPRTLDYYKEYDTPIGYSIKCGELEYFIQTSYTYERLQSRCDTGMFVTGFLIGVVPGLLLLAYGFVYALCIPIVCGFYKMAAYRIGWSCFGNTESAEYMNGAFIWSYFAYFIISKI